MELGKKEFFYLGFDVINKYAFDAAMRKARIHYSKCAEAACLEGLQNYLQVGGKASHFIVENWIPRRRDRGIRKIRYVQRKDRKCEPLAEEAIVSIREHDLEAQIYIFMTDIQKERIDEDEFVRVIRPEQRKTIADLVKEILEEKATF